MMRLRHGRWTGENRAALQELLARDFRVPPIAIFDWDNTCIRGDTSDFVFHELCRDLAFQFDAPGFAAWVQELPVPTRIFQAVEAFRSRPTRDTRAALRFELERTRWALHESEDDNQAWAWDTGAFVGWTPAAVREYTRRVIARELAQPRRVETLTHPAHMHAQAVGAAAVNFDVSGPDYLARAREMRAMDLHANLTLELARGLRVRPEMQELISEMRRAGWRVHILSASPQWEVEAFAERYFIPRENVIGMRRAVVNGKITAAFEPPCSWGDGKLDAYQMFVTRERPPNFCAGDSIGDWKLLEWATDAALLLEPTSDSLRDLARRKQSIGETWLVQKFED
jgi:phosphoserine phosphatase